MYATLSRLELLKRFFSNAGWYGASIVLTRAGWLILLPIYWQILSPEDFGIIGIAQVVQSLLIPVLTLGIADATQRLYLEWPSDERPGNLSTSVSSVVAIAALICGALDAVGGTVLPLLFQQVSYDPYFRIAIWTAFLGAAALTPLAVLRVQERILPFSVITVTAFLVQAATGVYLVVSARWGPAGYLVGSLAGAGVAAVLSLGALTSHMRWGFSARCLRRSLGYGLPPALAMLIESVSQGLDRFFLDKHVALAQIGLYSLANQFGNAFNIFNTALKTSWFPFLYRTAAERADLPEVLGKFAVMYLAVLALPGLAVSLFAEDFINFFGGERFRGVYHYVPAFVLYYFVLATLTSIGRGMDLAKKTRFWPLVPIAGLIVTLTALFHLVPAHGVAGALVAIVLGASARAVVQIGLSLYYYPRPLYWERLAGVLCVVAAAFVVGDWFAPDDLLQSVLFKLLLLLGCTPLALWLGSGRPTWRHVLALVRSQKTGALKR